VKQRITLDRSKVAEILVVCSAIGGLFLIAWKLVGTVPLAFYYGYIVASLAIGLALYFGLQRLDQPLRRRMLLILLGTSLFGAAVFRDPQYALFQIEGLVFDLLNGVLFAAVIHYLLAKIIGPLLFGRVWCGWACWTAAVLDQLPYKRSPGRVLGNWGDLRYIHFACSVLLVTVLSLGFAYRPGSTGADAIAWFLGGNVLYYALGITLAIVLKDNRAFCKYLCPISVLLKLGARHALLKVAAEPGHCCNERICEKVCPMDIRIADYLEQGQRVLSSECILCQACISVCPDQALTLSFGRDNTSIELLRIRDEPRIEDTKLP
jgi:ferredoxin-type protein NapH